MMSRREPPPVSAVLVTVRVVAWALPTSTRSASNASGSGAARRTRERAIAPVLSHRQGSSQHLGHPHPALGGRAHGAAMHQSAEDRDPVEDPRPRLLRVAALAVELHGVHARPGAEREDPLVPVEPAAGALQPADAHVAPGTAPAPDVRGELLGGPEPP